MKTFLFSPETLLSSAAISICSNRVLSVTRTLIEGMDLCSPDKFSVDNINLDEDDGSIVGELNQNPVISKRGADGYGNENDALGGRTQVVSNHQHHGSSSLHAVVRSEKVESPYNKSSSQVQPRQYNDDEIEEDIKLSKERRHSYQGDETGIASGRESEKSSQCGEEANFQPELEMEDPSRFSSKLPPEVNSSFQLEDMKERSLHGDILMGCSDHILGMQHEKSDPAPEAIEDECNAHLIEKEDGGNKILTEDEYNSGISLPNNEEIEGRSADVDALGRTPKISPSPVREISVSPERAPDMHRQLSHFPQGNHDSLSSPRSSRQKFSSSPQRTGEDHPSSPRSSRQKFSPSPQRTGEDHPSLSARQKSPSPSRRSRRESPRRDESLRQRLSSSPRRRPLSPDHRRADRSVSRSPTRTRNSSYVSRRDHRFRSRSRSPHARNRYRRSPRRYSPRRRSSPGYHSHYRSPRRRPWSPPRDRNNGVGKPGNNLFVAGFNFVTTERDLERKFSRFGRVRDVRIVRDKRSGDSRGFGFLSLEKDEDADAAIRALDQTEWNGRVVLVEKSKTH